MDLTIREAAALLGRSPRAVRAQVARGELPGTRRGRAWILDSQKLPLTAEQHREFQPRAARVREMVDSALPSRAASTRDRKRHSAADLRPFQMGLAVLAEIRASTDPVIRAVEPGLEIALLRLGEGAHAWPAHAKGRAFTAARRAFSRCAARLLLCPDHEVARRLADKLENDVLPTLSGLLRWTERVRPRPSRRVAR